MATKIFSTADRDKSHKKLSEVLKSGIHPNAECRENLNDVEPYSVWDGPEEWVQKPPEQEPALAPTPTDLDKLADLVVAKLVSKGLGK